MSKGSRFKVFMVIVCITTLIATMFAVCCTQTPGERFEKRRNNITIVDSELRDVVKAKSKETLEDNGYYVEDLFIKCNYIDGMNNIYIYALANKNGDRDVYTFKLSSKVQGPLCTLLRKGSSDGMIYQKLDGKCSIDAGYILLNGKIPLIYCEECSYHLEGDTIVMEE